MVEMMQAAWLDYKKRALPHDEPRYVLVERRRSFFAGAASVMDILANIDAAATDEEGAAILRLLVKEMLAHVAMSGKPEERRKA